MATRFKNVSRLEATGTMLSGFATKIAGIPGGSVKRFRDWKERNRPVMPGYSGTNIWRKYRMFWFALFVAWCIFYGFLVGIFGSFYVISMTFPIIFLLPVAIWVMPETGRPPAAFVEVWFFVFLAAIMIWPDYLAIAVPGLPWITAVRIAGFLLALAFMISLSVSKDFRAHLKLVLSAAPALWKLISVFTIFMFLSISWSSQPVFSLNKFVIAQFNWVLIFFSAVYVFSRPGRLVLLVYMMFALTLANCALGIWEWYLKSLPWAGHIPSFLRIDDEAVQRILSPRSRSATGVYRIQSKFTTPLGLAEFLAYSTPFVMHLVMTARQYILRFAAAASLPIIFYIILLTDSRLGMAGFFVAFLVYVFVWAWRRWARDRASLFGPAIIMAYPLIALFTLLSTFFVGRVRNLVWGTGAQQASNDTRREMYDLGVQKLIEQPWGYGLGRSAETLGFVDGNGVVTIDTYYMMIALDTGIAGFLVYYAAVIVAIIYCLKLLARSANFENMLIAPIMICIVNFLIIKSVFSQIETHPMIYALMGAVVALTARYKLGLDKEDGDSKGAAMIPDYLKLATWKYKAKEQ